MVRFLNWANARPAGLAANVERKRPRYRRTEEPEAEAFKGLHLELEASESMQLDEEAGAPTWEDVLARAEFHTPAAARRQRQRPRRVADGRKSDDVSSEEELIHRASKDAVLKARVDGGADFHAGRAEPGAEPAERFQIMLPGSVQEPWVASSPLSARRWRSRRRSWSASWSARGRASAVWSPRSATSRSRRWPSS